ncbi:MAG: ABC transporter permease [Actinobacteria bacterium]|nr:ABC transporter permease [Actinomycetota bacterium]MDQ3531795.1 ABC transporter permease [Actinomycetota bacterium]
MNATKVVRRNALVFWRGWRSSMFLSVLGPVLFLTAMGLGLGSLVDPNVQAFGGASYIAFFATGMLAANCMQSAAFSASYPMMSKLTWQRNYEAMLATPLEVRDIYFGELAWIGVTLAQQTIPFFAVMALFGIFDSPLAVLAIPAAVLTGLGFGAAVMALTATLKTDEAYTWLFRFVVTPLFLLSGTFFPINDLPVWGVAAAQLTPLYHGIELIRGMTISNLTLVAGLTHLTYLLLFLAVGIVIGVRNLTHRLVP